MKQLIVFVGLSVCSTAAFSQQQVSNARKPIAAPVPGRMNSSEELVSDSTAVSTMKKPANQQNAVIPPSNGAGLNQEQTPVVTSTKRKPE